MKSEAILAVLLGFLIGFIFFSYTQSVGNRLYKLESELRATQNELWSVESKINNNLIK